MADAIGAHREAPASSRSRGDDPRAEPSWRARSRPSSWSPIDDVAELVANVLGREEAYERRIRFGGPEAVTWRHIVALAEEVLDVTVDVTFVDPGQPVPGLDGFQLGVLEGTEQFDSPDTTDEVARRFDADRTTVEAFLRAWARDRT